MKFGIDLDDDTASRAPHVELLDARLMDLDEAALRAAARKISAAEYASYSSRSYRYPFALIGWHSEPIGVDVERIEPFDAVFADFICNTDERTELAQADDVDRELSSLWSAKEALSKALGDARSYVPARLESPARWPNGKAGPWRAAPLAAPPQHVAWACWRDTTLETHSKA